MKPHNLPKKRISLKRLLILILVIAGLAYYSNSSWHYWRESKTVSNENGWFAAYVDVTSTPRYAFEQPKNSVLPHSILSFIVSSPSDPCLPTWGGYYTLDEAAQVLDLDRRIARLRQLEGRIAISFGGAINQELALSCEDEERLFGAYKAVVERYAIDTIDLDLENESLKSVQAAQSRARVIQKLQAYQEENGKKLAVWLTLPVAPQGLTPEGTDAVAIMLEAKVDLAGINVMTMNYGESKNPLDTMSSASILALTETHRQLGILYRQAGINLSQLALWKKIGITPMIGQNDVVNEVFSVQDALSLNEFAREKGVRRMSMWSANRDVSCGDNYVDVKKVSDSCSGIKADAFTYSNVLSNGFDGDMTTQAAVKTIEDGEEVEQIFDDPSNSPYQIWSESGSYIRGTKVVWRRNVYEAKWWTKNDAPDNPVLQSWETPWQLIGPVLPGEVPIPPLTLPEKTYPLWSGLVIYNEGDRVLFEGIPFQAKWWNQGQSPAASKANADSSPWEPLSEKEIKRILDQTASASAALSATKQPAKQPQSLPTATPTFLE